MRFTYLGKSYTIYNRALVLPSSNNDIDILNLMLCFLFLISFSQLHHRHLNEPLRANILQRPGHRLYTRMNARCGWIGDVKRANSKGKRITLFQPSWQQIVNGIQTMFNTSFLVKEIVLSINTNHTNTAGQLFSWWAWPREWHNNEVCSVTPVSTLLMFPSFYMGDRMRLSD